MNKIPEYDLCMECLYTFAKMHGEPDTRDCSICQGTFCIHNIEETMRVNAEDTDVYYDYYCTKCLELEKLLPSQEGRLLI